MDFFVLFFAFVLDAFLFARSWQSRRILWTENYIVFSRADNNVLIDSIPLCEIKSVEQFKEALNNTNHQTEEEDSAINQFQSLLTRKKSMAAVPATIENIKYESNSQTTNGLDPQASSTNIIPAGAQSLGGNSEVFTRMLHSKVMQIKTDPDGHNSGRTYYLRAKESDDVGQLITRLSSLAKSARKKSENKSRFERNQLTVRRVYNSRPFQYMMAALIFGVGYLYHRFKFYLRSFVSNIFFRILLRMRRRHS
jgi:hypothetical protein